MLARLMQFILAFLQFTLWYAFALTWKCLGIDVGNWWIFWDVLVSWLDGFWCDVFVGHVYPLTPCLLTLLFTATFVAARRVRYSSPWLRALFLGGNLHLDVVWATRLVSAVLRFRLRSGALPSWVGKRGSCAACLRRRMAVKGFVELFGVVPWVRACYC